MWRLQVEYRQNLLPATKDSQEPVVPIMSPALTGRAVIESLVAIRVPVRVSYRARSRMATKIERVHLVLDQNIVVTLTSSWRLECLNLSILIRKPFRSFPSRCKKICTGLWGVVLPCKFWSTKNENLRVWSKTKWCGPKPGPKPNDAPGRDSWSPMDP